MWGKKSLLLFILMQNQISRNCAWVVLLVLFTTLASQAQVKVGDSPTALNEGAVLEMQSTNRGMLLPRISLSSTTTWGLNGNNAVKNGMVVYNTNAAITGNAMYPAAGVGTYTFDGTGWVFSENLKGGTTGQVLSKTATGLAWSTPASGVVTYLAGSATAAGAFIKATGPGVTFTVNTATQTGTITVPLGVELLSVRMFDEGATGSSGSYGMSNPSNSLNIRVEYTGRTISYVSTFLPQIQVVLNGTPSVYMDTYGVGYPRQYELSMGGVGTNFYTITIPLMNPETLGNRWSVLLNF